MHRIISLVFIAAIFVSSCYESTYPLAPLTNSRIDPALLGTWEQLGEDKSVKLLILQFNEQEYYVRWQAGDDGDIIRCRGYTVQINGTPFMNLQNINPDGAEERTFVFFRYSLEDKQTLKAQMLSDRLFDDVTISSSTELREFVAGNLGNDKLYEDQLTFRGLPVTR